MKNHYDAKLDRYIFHDYPGLCGPQVTQFVLDEIELGARVALALDDPMQAWWELIGNKLYETELNHL